MWDVEKTLIYVEKIPIYVEKTLYIEKGHKYNKNMMMFLLNPFAVNSDENHKIQKLYILPLNSSLEMLVFNL